MAGVGTTDELSLQPFDLVLELVDHEVHRIRKRAPLRKSTIF